MLLLTFRQLQLARNANRLSVIPRSAFGLPRAGVFQPILSLQLACEQRKCELQAARRRRTRRIIRGNKLQVYVLCPSPVCKVEKRT
jgi:hypothetical protein